MDRYQATIRWSMYGHVHQEQYQVQTAVDDGKAIGMNYIVGSTTTFIGKNPSFNVIYLDPETMLPLEYETYAFDLTYANQHDDPRWFKEFDYKQNFTMPDLSPESFMAHSQLFLKDEAVARQFRNQRHVQGPAAGNLTAPCDS